MLRLASPISIILLLLFPLLLQATNANNNISIKKTTVKGFIIERNSNAPMPYTNVAIYQANDSILVSGGITAENGSFSIPNISPGNYYIKINFIGFDEFRVNNIIINNDAKEVNLGTISLAHKTTEIEGVKIVADKQRIQFQVDKKVVNVSQDINATGGTAIDVLENTPSIQVDVDGNVSVRGSSNFTVLIDGRPTTLEANDALQQIPASALENIEIITNPSAKYDPDGMGGILNLITKKNALNGFDGIINVMGSTNESYNLDLTINHRNEKRQITFGFDANKRQFNGKGNRYNELHYLPDSIYTQEQEGARESYRGGESIKLGADFYITPKTTIGFIAQAGTFNRARWEFGDYTYTTQYLDNSNPNHYSTKVSDNNESNNKYAALTTSLLSHFNNEKNHKLEGTFYYRYREGNDISLLSEQYFKDKNELSDKYALQARTNEDETNHELRAKLDYTRPVGSAGKLEAGWQMRSHIESENYNFENYSPTENAWLSNSDFTNVMDFNRQIHSIYSTFSSKVGRIEYMTGLRGEYTNRLIIDKANNKSKVNRFDWFPSAHISFNASEKLQLMSSYSRRIDRPRGWSLNPFESYVNQTTIRKGNPNLLPEYTNSFDISAMQKLKNSFISGEVFYRTTKGVSGHINTFRDSILIQQTMNTGDDSSLGGELMVNVEASKWLNINGSISAYQYTLNTTINNTSEKRTSTNADGRISATIKFSPMSRLQIMSSYRSPSVSAQGNREGVFYTNASYRQEFLKRKLSATLSIRDIFATSRWKGESKGEGFHQRFDISPQPQVAQLTLSYKLNNYKARKEVGSEMGNEMDFNDSM